MPVYYSKSQAQAGDLPLFLGWDFNDMLDYVDDNLVASIIYVNQNGYTSALYMPRKIKNDNTKKKQGIVGNMSDRQGTFFPASIMNDAEVSNGIIFIDKWNDVPKEARPAKALEADVLEGSPWAEATHKLCLVTVPSIIPGLFWSDFPEKSVKEDDFEEAFRQLSTRHADWAKCIKTAYEFYGTEKCASAIGAVFKKVMEKEGDFTDYVTSSRIDDLDDYDEMGIIPSLSRIESLYPNSTRAIKDYFAPPPTPLTSGTGAQPATQAPPQQHQGSLSPGMRTILEQNNKLLAGLTGGLTLTTHEDKTRENIAAYGLNKLWLFGITGDIDWERGEVSDPQLPSWSKTMSDYVKSNEQSGLRRTKVKDLLMTIFNQGFGNLTFNDKINPLVSNMSMSVIPDTLVRAILAGEFQTTMLASNLTGSSNQVTILHFLPQRDQVKVQEAKSNEMKKSANFMLANKGNVDHALQVIGTIESIDDINAIVANLNGVFGNIFDNTIPDKMPVILQVVCKTVEVLADHKVKDWIERNKAKQPQLPFLFLNQLHSVLVGLGEFSNNTANVSIADHASAEGREKEPLEGIYLTALQGCVRRFAKFAMQIEQKTVDDQVFESVPAFTPENRDPRVARMQEMMQRASLSLGAANVVGDAKANARKAEESPASSPTKDSKTSKRAKKKAKRKGADKDSDNSEENKLKGFVHKKSDTSWSQLWNPKETKLEKKPCGKFCCIGFSCGPSSMCDFDHLSSWKQFPESDRDALLKHWDASGLGWLDGDKLKAHNIELPEKYAHLKGDASGPKKKST